MKILFVITLLVFQLSAWAAPMENFKFDSAEQEKIFHKLSEELRCLVCQNQAIAESNADLAKDLRKEIHGMLLAGDTEEQIKEFMVDRYGDYVLYDPPFKPMTWLLWFAPIVVFAIGIVFARRFILQQNTTPAPDELSSEELQRIKDLQMAVKMSDQNKKNDDANQESQS
ncbi:MAG: cytochrome c-type biogenesis protein CcmH [Gammaproteobacteria bacterium]|nr:cytochrome c-type biogenesis protein CcmH [Gammaproteobacteria bacterium]